MLVATWVLAIATAILALSGPVAVFVYLNTRKQDRERRQREREDEMRKGILKDAADQAKGEFVSQTAAAKVTAVVTVVGVLGFVAWSDRRNGKQVTAASA